MFKLGHHNTAIFGDFGPFQQMIPYFACLNSQQKSKIAHEHGVYVELTLSYKGKSFSLWMTSSCQEICAIISLFYQYLTFWIIIFALQTEIENF